MKKIAIGLLAAGVLALGTGTAQASTGAYNPKVLNICSKVTATQYDGFANHLRYTFQQCQQGVVRLHYYGLNTLMGGAFPLPFIMFGNSGKRYLDMTTKVYRLKTGKYVATFYSNDLGGILAYSESEGYGQYRLVVFQGSHRVGSIVLITSKYSR